MRARGIAVVLSLCASTAVAEPNELGLAWQAPASCPDAASVRARIESRLGHSLDDETVSPEMDLGIDVAIARDHDHFVARIDLAAVTVATDVRTLTSSRCDELADAVAVIIARVTSEHRARKAVARVAPTPVAAPAHPPIVVAGRDTDDEAVEVHHDAPVIPPPPRLWSIGVRLSGVSGVGVVPQVGLGAEVALTVRHRSTLAEIGETSWLATSADVHLAMPTRVDIGLDVTSTRIGWRPEELPLRAWAIAEVGSMQGSGSGLANPLTGSGRWVAAGAGFGVAWQMTRWARLVGSTEVLGAFERVRFSLGDGVVVFAPSPVSARATCGIEVGWQ